MGKLIEPVENRVVRFQRPIKLEEVLVLLGKVANSIQAHITYDSTIRSEINALYEKKYEDEDEKPRELASPETDLAFAGNITSKESQASTKFRLQRIGPLDGYGSLEFLKKPFYGLKHKKPSPRELELRKKTREVIEEYFSRHPK